MINAGLYGRDKNERSVWVGFFGEKDENVLGI
jgi:hypothetical protein